MSAAASSGPEGSEGLPEEDGFRYILVIMDDLSNFVSLEPAEACTAEVTAKHLLNWCKTMAVSYTHLTLPTILLV